MTASVLRCKICRKTRIRPMNCMENELFEKYYLASEEDEERFRKAQERGIFRVAAEQVKMVPVPENRQGEHSRGGSYFPRSSENMKMEVFSGNTSCSRGEYRYGIFV